MDAAHKARLTRVTCTNIDRVAGLYVTDETNATLSLMAANDINLNAAQMHNQSQNGSTILDAGHDINLSTVNTSNAISTGHRKNYIKREETQDIGTQIRTQGDVSLSAGNDANLKAANINNENGKLTIQADNDINLTTGKVIDPC